MKIPACHDPEFTCFPIRLSQEILGCEMGKVSEIRQLLRSLCLRARSKYAIFWKYRGRSQTLLGWEDSYCVPSDLRSALREECWNEHFSRTGGFISFSSEVSSSCPIEQAVASQSCHLYSVGEGIVGKVALDWKHRRIVPRTSNSKIPEELRPHFEAGIKAVLFVAVPALGVIQLGFLETVAEDPSTVALVQEIFSSRAAGWSIFDSYDGSNFLAYNGGEDLPIDGNSWRSIYRAISGGGVNDRAAYPDVSEELSLFSPEVNACSYDGDVDLAFGGGLVMGPEMAQPLGPSFLQGPPGDLERLLDSVIAEFLESEAAARDFSDGASPSSSDDHVAGSCLTHVKSEADPPPGPVEPSFLFPVGDQTEREKKKKQSTNPPLLAQKPNSRGPDSARPRPRDRQLIQDRIKELRELVPNAAKCSIDTLLDRTVKLMQFLQSISSQGEKLRQYAQIKGKKRKRAEGCDLLSLAEACPIVVENLDQPGHMLVEVLCTDYGFFMEIAQVIKQLELTILRGVLETRSHELWGHFIVEGSRGFHRMDILWPLMQLLQRQSGSNMSSL
ncbi:transcription factor EMB1444-like [Wolffia australiana]